MATKRSEVKVDLWNRALDRIGQTDSIEDEDEDRVAANVCRRHHDDCVEEALERKEFPWSGYQVTPNLLGTTRVGWAYTYALPADFIAPRAILSGGVRYSLTEPTARIPCEIQANDAGDGQVLCTDYAFEGEDTLEYTRRISNIAAWPRQFLSAVAWRLAVELYLAIVKDPIKARGAAEAFERELALAYSLSMNQQTPDQPLEAESIRARG